MKLNLKKIVNHYGKFKNQNFSVDDLGGTDDLEKSKKYLNSITKINFSEFEPEWPFIKKCKSLRNKIVHQEGVIKLADDSLMKFVRETPSIEFDESTEDQTHIKIRIVNKELIDKLLLSGEKLIEKLIEKLEYDK